MKRKNILILTLLSASLLSMTGCAQTPDQPLVAQKNHERLEQAAKQEPQAGSSLKEVAETTNTSYSFQYESEDGTITISAEDIPVTLPPKDSIPMYHVHSGAIPQEVADRFYNYFFPEGGYWLEGTDCTKDQISERILELEQNVANLKDDTDLTEAEREEMIQQLENVLTALREEREKAPEESTLRVTPRDSTYGKTLYSSLDGEVAVDELSVVCENNIRYLDILSGDAQNQMDSHVYYIDPSQWNYHPDYGTPVEDCSAAEIEEIGISQEQATEIVQDFIQAIGMDWEIHDVFCVSGYQDTETEVITSDSFTAFQFVLAQSVDGIQNAVTSSTYIPEDDSAVTWLYESIDLIVEPNGIAAFNWRYPLTVEDTVSENVGIISFDAAKDIFENMMPLTAKGDLEQWRQEYLEMGIKVTLSDIRLGLMRVRNGGADRTGLLIPVWLFYGDYNRSFHYLPGNPALEYGAPDLDAFSEPHPWILLAVNAVDGSVIDITEGY